MVEAFVLKPCCLVSVAVGIRGEDSLLIQWSLLVLD